MDRWTDIEKHAPALTFNNQSSLLLGQAHSARRRNFNQIFKFDEDHIKHKYGAAWQSSRSTAKNRTQEAQPSVIFLLPKMWSFFPPHVNPMGPR